MKCNVYFTGHEVNNCLSICHDSELQEIPGINNVLRNLSLRTQSLLDN